MQKERRRKPPHEFMTDFKCMKCLRPLTYDEVALHRKMVNRGAREFMCITCLADYFKVSEDALRERIDYFKKTGCTLFMM